MIKKASANKIKDQFTDISGAVLVKIASRLENTELASHALETLFSMNRADRANFTKEASFPTDSFDNVMLSRIYLEGQRDQIDDAKYAELDERIGKYEVLMGVPSMGNFKPMEKKAAAPKEYELMPGVCVSTYEGLMKLGEDFSKQYTNLSFNDRLLFTENFTKLAEYEDIPEDIAVYTSNVELREDCIDQLGFRKAAAERCGKDGSPYASVAEFIKQAEEVDEEDLFKLAETVYEIDRELGFTDRSYDRRMPDAWHALFKKAEETANQEDSDEKDKKSTEMDKSDVVSRFGEGALDEVENPDGTINQERLRQIRAMFGDPDSDKDNDEHTNG